MKDEGSIPERRFSPEHSLTASASALGQVEQARLARIGPVLPRLLVGRIDNQAVDGGFAHWRVAFEAIVPAESTRILGAAH